MQREEAVAPCWVNVCPTSCSLHILVYYQQKNQFKQAQHQYRPQGQFKSSSLQYDSVPYESVQCDSVQFSELGLTAVVALDVHLGGAVEARDGGAQEAGHHGVSAHADVDVMAACRKGAEPLTVSLKHFRFD